MKNNKAVGEDAVVTEAIQMGGPMLVLQITQRKMESSMLGITLRYRIRNEEVHRRSRVEHIADHLLGLNWRREGHVARMQDNR